MKKNIIYISIFFYVIVAQNKAHAYIDPGTGSMIMQILVAIVGTIGYVVTTSFNKIKEFFKLNNKK